MRWTTWGTVAVLLLALSRDASAQQMPGAAPIVLPRAELDYQIAAHLTCPTAEQLRADVAKEMRYDALDVRAGVPSGRFHVVIAHGQPGALRVRVSFDDASGQRDFETEFEGTPETARTCSHLVSKHVVTEIAMQLTLLIARGFRDLPPPREPACSRSGPFPVALPGAEPPSCPESPYSVWPREPPMRVAASNPPKPERWPVAVRFGTAAWAELIAKGTGSLGLSAEAGARYRFISFGVELHGDPSLGSQSFPYVGDVSFARVSGALLLCAHFGWFMGCGVGDAGRILFPHHAAVLPPSAFYGATGVRAGLELPVAPPRLFLTVTLDLRVPIRAAQYTYRGDPVFDAAGLSGAFGLGARFEISP